MLLPIVAEFPERAYSPQIPKEPLDTVVVMGCGEDVHERFGPAFSKIQSEWPLRVVVLGIEPPDRPLPSSIEFYQIRSDRLDIDWLHAEGLTGPNVLAVIATPDLYHVHYVRLLLGYVGRIASEKPLSLSALEAQALGPIVRGLDVHCFSHFLFKPSTFETLKAQS